MPRSASEARKRLLRRTRGWPALAASEGGGQMIGCCGCGRSWDLLDLVERGALQRPRLPCGCDAQPFPLAELRKPETYGVSS